MSSRSSRWLLMLALVAVFVGGSWFGRDWLAGRAKDRLAQHYHERLQALPDAAAAHLVRELALAPNEWLKLIVSAMSDSRPAVAAAAQAELLAIVERWSARPSAEISSAAAELARLLAHQVPRLPADRRDVAHAIVQRLIDWPIDGRRVDEAKFIADCQQVLLLPRSELAEVRVADVSARPASPAPAQPRASIAPAVPSDSAALPIAPETQAGAPAASEDARREPGRFTAPNGIRISDE